MRETVHIGDNIIVRVLEWKGGSIRLGFEAPPEVHILRGELQDRRKVQVKGSSQS
jgi:carbon storage regulator